MILLAWYGTPLTSAWCVFPWILTVQVLFIAGIVLWGAALYVLKRDVGSLLPLVLQVWMYLSPVIYPADLIPSAYRAFYLLNPMAAVIEAYRSVTLGGAIPPLAVMAPATVIALTVFVSGYVYFKHTEVRFADIM